MKKMVIVVLSFLGFTLASTSFAADVSIENLEVFANPVQGRPAAVYMVMKNAGDSPAVLKALIVPAVKKAMIHESTNINGVRRMEHRTHAVVPAHGEMVFKRGAWHGMLMGTKDLRVGDEIEVTFDFVEHQDITLKAIVKAVGQ